LNIDVLLDNAYVIMVEVEAQTELIPRLAGVHEASKKWLDDANEFYNGLMRQRNLTSETEDAIADMVTQDMLQEKDAEEAYQQWLEDPNNPDHSQFTFAP
jgi:rubrerythrin